MVGYIEEYDTEEEEEREASDADDGGRFSGDERSSYHRYHRKSSSLSGSDSDGDATHRGVGVTPRASSIAQARMPAAGGFAASSRVVLRLGRLTSFSGDGGGNNDEQQQSAAATTAKMRRRFAATGGGRSSSTADSRSSLTKSTGSESDSSDNTGRGGGGFKRRVSVGAKNMVWAAAGGGPGASSGRGVTGVGVTGVGVGPGVKLSAEASAIMNAGSPVPANDDDNPPEREDRSKSAPSGGGGLKPAWAPFPSNPKPTLGPSMTALDVGGPGSQGEPAERLRRSVSTDADRPLVFDRAVNPRWMEVGLPVPWDLCFFFLGWHGEWRVIVSDTSGRHDAMAIESRRGSAFDLLRSTRVRGGSVVKGCRLSATREKAALNTSGVDHIRVSRGLDLPFRCFAPRSKAGLQLFCCRTLRSTAVCFAPFFGRWGERAVSHPFSMRSSAHRFCSCLGFLALETARWYVCVGFLAGPSLSVVLCGLRGVFFGLNLDTQTFSGGCLPHVCAVPLVFLFFPVKSNLWSSPRDSRRTNLLLLLFPTGSPRSATRRREGAPSKPWGRAC